MNFNKNFLMAAAITSITWVFTSAFVVDLPFSSLMLIFLISYPWKIGKNIYSIFGGINDENEGSVYSLFALIQKAEKDTFTIFGLFLYQNAGGNAVQFFGLALYQNAGGDALQGFSLAFCQRAGENADQLVGIALCQNAGGDTWQGFGLAFCQRAGGNAKQGFGLTFYQNARGVAEQAAGLTVFSEAVSFRGSTFAVIRVARKTKLN